MISIDLSLCRSQQLRSPRQNAGRFLQTFLWFTALSILLFVMPSSAQTPDWFSWQKGPDLPEPRGLSAGFIGLHRNALLYAGGSNFDKPRWEGGSKAFHRDVFVLENPGQTGSAWKKVGTWPHPVADGAAVEVPEGLLCLGGTDGTRTFADAVLLRWDAARRRVVLDATAFPPLPEPCANPAAARLGDAVYVMGGKGADGKALTTVWKLTLSGKTWEPVPTWPGPARFGAALVRQSNGERDALYLFGGKSDSAYLNDAYRFDPTGEPRWQPLSPLPRPALLAPAVAFGPTHVLLFSGSDGHDLDKIPRIRSADDYRFTTEVLAYHTVTNTWVTAGQLPKGLVGSRAVPMGKQFWIPGGEICPSVRTPWVQVADFSGLATKGQFGWLDYGALGGYFLSISGIGLWFNRRKKSAEQFLRGGQKIPFWAVGISVMATQVSAVGFMTIPAKTYATNWAYFAGVATWFLVVPLVNWAFIPFYRKLNLTSAYEYLEARFDKTVRLLAACAFVLFQFVRMGLVLYLPALALSAVVPIDTLTSILLMGVLSTLYTALGGIEAVIWIEVAQAILLFGGALLCFILAVTGLDGGFGQFWEVATRDQKFSLGTIEWSWVSTSVWFVFLGNVFNRLGNLTSDQAIVQRYMTTASLAEARRSLWTDVVACIPWAVLIYALGTALYAYFQQHPGQLVPTMATDGVLPAFIALRAPAGVCGLIIAAIFAASMSTLESSIHSVATISLTDFYARMRPRLSDRQRLAFLKAATFALGGLATLISVSLLYIDVKSLLDFFTEVLGVFAGASMGLFFLGIFSRRANARGALLGVLLTTAVMAWVVFFSPLSFWLYSVIGLLTCYLSGEVFSRLTGQSNTATGLTIFSKNEVYSSPKTPLPVQP